MHELGLLSAMVKTIEGIAQEEGLERVENVEFYPPMEISQE